MGIYVDGLKFSGGPFHATQSDIAVNTADASPGSFSLFHEDRLTELIDLAHEHGVYVSTVRRPAISLVSGSTD